MSSESETEESPFTPEQEAEFRQIALDRAPNELAKLQPEMTDEEAFVHLPRAAAAAFHLGRSDLAAQLAERTLLLAPHFESNWNYGNAIHRGHTVLGLLALDRGDVACAKAELVLSGETPGSPQLNSFGPTMHLARELLKHGHTEVVLGYFQQCRRFWSIGTTWLDLWEQVALSGRVPNCFQHAWV